MEVMVLRSDMADAMSLVASVVGKSSLEILQHVLIKADSDGLMLRGTNFETTMTVWCRQASVMEPGIMTAPGRLLTELLAAWPFDEVGLEIDPDEYMLKIVGYDGDLKKNFGIVSRLKSLSPEDFPHMRPLADDAVKVKVDSFWLKSLLAQVFHCAPVESKEIPALEGVNFVVSGGCLEVVATNRVRLGMVRLDGVDLPDVDFTIPYQAASLLLNKLKANTAIDITIDDKMVMFRLDDPEFMVEIVSSRCGMAYPDYRRIIPRALDIEFVASRHGLLKAAKSLSQFCDRKVVTLDMSPSRVTLVGSSVEYGSARSPLDVTWLSPHGQPLSKKFFVNELVGALTALQDDMVTVGYAAAGNGLMTLTSTTGKQILSPVVQKS